MNPEVMKKIGMKMNILMGVSLSFGLSLVGNLTSGHFTVPGFLISFVTSMILSLIIGFVVPIRKITGNALRKRGLKEGETKAKLLDSCISDLIYTPIITLLMVFLAYSQAKRGGAPVSFLSMFLPSLIISLIVGFILIYILQPVYLKLLLKKNH